MKSGLKITIIAIMTVVVLALGIVLVGFADGGEESADGTAPVSAQPSTEAAMAEESGGLHFSTTALDGSTVDESLFEGKSLVMLNFWEPWCGPCVGEMPDLQKISEEYSDKGLLIVGVYSTVSGTQETVDRLGISYPIILNCDAFNEFMTGYVPTTVFVDGDGNVLSEPIVGSRNYEGWKELIDSLLV